MFGRKVAKKSLEEILLHFQKPLEIHSKTYIIRLKLRRVAFAEFRKQLGGIEMNLITEARSLTDVAPDLNGIMAVWLGGQLRLPKVVRWGKYVHGEEGGARRQNSLEHSYSIALLGPMIVHQLVEQVALDESLLITALLVHDYGEGELGTDTVYIDKAVSGDLAEYLAFEARFSTLSPNLYVKYQKAFLLQFALKNPECFPEDARRMMRELAQTNRNDCLAFEAIERYDYVLFAYEQWAERNNAKILVQVLRHQISPLNVLVETTFPAFGAVWTPTMRQWCESFVKEYEGRWIEQKGEK